MSDENWDAPDSYVQLAKRTHHRRPLEVRGDVLVIHFEDGTEIEVRDDAELRALDVR